MVKSATSISLSLLIFLSSFGVTLSSHYCGDLRIKSAIGIGKTILSCGMIEESCDAITFDNPTGFILKNDCCKNQHEKISIDHFSLSNFIFVFNINLYNLPVLFKMGSVSIFRIAFKAIREKSPPLLNKDIITLIQTFRI